MSTAKYDPQGYHIVQPQPQLPRPVMPSSTSATIGSSTTRYLSAANSGSVAPTVTSMNAHMAALPHFRDDVWAMPPAALAQKEPDHPGTIHHSGAVMPKHGSGPGKLLPRSVQF